MHEPETGQHLDRRQLLAGALAAGGAAALAGPAAALATSPGDASKTEAQPAATFFKEPARAPTCSSATRPSSPTGSG